MEELNQTANAYVATERLYLDKDGNVVKHDDPNKVTLLAAEGGRISFERAKALGLKTDEDDERAEKKFRSLFKGAKGEADEAARNDPRNRHANAENRTDENLLNNDDEDEEEEMEPEAKQARKGDKSETTEGKRVVEDKQVSRVERK